MRGGGTGNKVREKGHDRVAVWSAATDCSDEADLEKEWESVERGVAFGWIQI